MKNLTTLLFLVLCGLHFNYTLGQISDQELEKLLQSASEKKLVSKNTELLMNGFFYQSIPIASALLQKKDNANYNYRKGFAIFKTTSHFSKAIPYLKKAAQNTTSSFDYFSSREESAPLEATFYLGRIYHLMANIPKAKEYYHAYLENKPKDKRRKEKAQLMLQQCEVATRLLKNPNKDFKIINLGNKINSKYPDYAPIISLDGAVLYFTSRRLREDGSNKEMKELYTNMYFEDIYKARRIDTSSWGDPKLMAFCLPNRNEASVAVSPDERSIYIYQDDKGHGDLYVTTFYDNQFKELKPVPILGVNTDFWEPSITTTPDGQYKFFVSNREGGFGGRDIYRIVKLPNGEWSKPQNLGPTINTPYDEDAPFMAVDNKTLYFSSNGPKSMGKFDIFVSIFNAKDQTWSTPINLGPPLNSTGDDIYFTTTANGKTDFFYYYR